MNLGIDKGSMYTKTVNEEFPSIIKEASKELSLIEMESLGQRITIQGKDYIIGGTGDYATDLLKSQQENTKLLIYAAIARSMDRNVDLANIVVGLPINQYTKQREAMKELLYTPNFIDCVLPGNVRRSFKIGEMEVFPEGAGIFYSLDTKQYINRKVIVLDIGGLSVDVVEFINRKMGNYSTYPLGVMKLNAKVVDEINRTFDTQLTEWNMERIRKDGLRIEGEQVTFNESSIRAEHVEDIYRKLKLEYDLRSTDEIIVAGGGGILLEEEILKKFKQARLIPNASKANEEGFHKISEVVFSAAS